MEKTVLYKNFFNGEQAKLALNMEVIDDRRRRIFSQLWSTCDEAAK
jgi:hypothetical protein